MDHHTLVLAGEVVALLIAIALGIWRIRYNKRESKWAAESSTRYDMRRDGQRLTA